MKHEFDIKGGVTPSVGDLPVGLSSPARRALAGAGIECLDHLTLRTEAEIKKLHGIGPNALNLLRRTLRAKGLSFKNAAKR